MEYRLLVGEIVFVFQGSKLLSNSEVNQTGDKQHLTDQTLNYTATKQNQKKLQSVVDDNKTVLGDSYNKISKSVQEATTPKEFRTIVDELKNKYHINDKRLDQVLDWINQQEQLKNQQTGLKTGKGNPAQQQDMTQISSRKQTDITRDERDKAIQNTDFWKAA